MRSCKASKFKCAITCENYLTIGTQRFGKLRAQWLYEFQESLCSKAFSSAGSGILKALAFFHRGNTSARNPIPLWFDKSMSPVVGNSLTPFSPQQ
jgi:hypothetical protein